MEGAAPAVDHLLKDNTPLDFYAWIESAGHPGWDILIGNPFAKTLPEDQFTSAQNYFAEYYLEYFRQRLFDHFPSRLHAQLLFATRVDAETFQARHPARVSGKTLVCTRSSGAYLCSFHDSSWLDYLRLPHSLTLASLAAIARQYWQGILVEEAGLTFMNQDWQQAAVIEALFQGTLEPLATPLASLPQPPARR